jgi:uncharacterized membrane protein
MSAPNPLEHTLPARWRMTPFRWLAVAIGAFVLVSFALSWLRSIEFQTTTWDLGVYEQAIWTSAHGRAFYETPDVETGGFGSLLQVHSVFLLYLLVPLYGALPDAITLFAVQSVAVALAAVPLFYLARDLSSSSRAGLVTGLVYLAWTPVLSSTLYDFHPEAFLPVELFTLALLWERGRYAWGFAVGAVAFSTMELAPVLTFFLGAFGLYESLQRSPDAARLGRFPRNWGGSLDRIRLWLSVPRVRASLGLMVASVAAYELLLFLRVDVLTVWLGTHPTPTPVAGYVIGGTPAGLQLSWANASMGLDQKLVYWGMAAGLLAFVPLFAPRALVLSVPWFAFTLFSANPNYVTLGFQYGFIVASSLMVAFAYGFPVAQRVATRFASRLARPRATPGRAADLTLRWSEIRRGRQAVLIVGLTAFLAANLALTPLNPLMDNQPALGAAYRLSYTPNPNDAQVRELVGLIPSGATVVASDNLFPLIANDANAYSFSLRANPGLGLPFSPTHLPSYVLLAQDSRDAVQAWLPPLLYDSSDYGVRGVVWSSDPGVILLFETGYTGAPTQLGTPPVPGGTYWGNAVVYPLGGTVTTAPDSAYPSVVVSAPGVLGPVWFGPGSSVAPGNLSFRLSVRATPLSGTPAPGPDTPVLSIGAEAWGVTVYSTRLAFGALDGSNWTTIEVTVTVPEPTIEFGIVGVALSSSVQVTLNYLSLAPGGPS